MTVHETSDHRYVTVNGKRAAWLFTEFETDRSLSGLVDWLEPDDWDEWGQPFFQKMAPIGPRTESRSGDQWQDNFLEVVNLGDQTLHTVLRCDYEKAEGWAAMTYDLHNSLDGKLQVDRGFLAAMETPGGRRQVKALKVVGFTDPTDTDLAEEVGPMWTAWIKAAIVAEEEMPTEPKDRSMGHHGPRRSKVTLGSASDYYGDRANLWTDCVTDMAQFYSGYATDVGSRLYSGQYMPADAAQDSGRLFLRLARDWSRLCRAGTEMAEALADADVPPTGSGEPTTDFTDLIVSAPAQPARVSLSDFLKVGLEDTKLDASQIKIEPETVGRPPNQATIRLKVDPRRGSCGLYAGHLTLGKKSPALVYISKARPVV